jgi:hypothetical protein
LIAWPGSLVREIAKQRAVFFLGSGVSASSEDIAGNRPATWRDFLNDACSKVQDPGHRTEIQGFISAQKYLLALQAIKTCVDEGDYHHLLTSHFNNPRFLPSELHKVILNLDLRLVITTNFDKIYESYCESTTDEGYKIITYLDESLSDCLREDTRLIIKAHGSINNINRMIFTKEEYHKAKRDHPQFYEILKAIFLTHTCVFIGCSLEDPDILLLLEDVKITSSANLPHYALLKDGSQNHFEIEDFKRAYNIKPLVYGPGHEHLIDDLSQLLQEVQELRSLATPS